MFENADTKTSKADHDDSVVRNQGLSRLIRLNKDLHHVAKQNSFPIIAVIVLTLASWATTYFGLSIYTGYRVIAFLAASGVQILMFYASIHFADLEDKLSEKGISILVLFFSAMSISAFFSFAAFHQAVEPPSRRLEEADTLFRTEWTRLYSNVRIQVEKELSERLDARGQSGMPPYQVWRENVEILRGVARSYHSDAEAELGGREDMVKRKNEANNIDTSRTQLRENSRKREALLKEEDQLRREINDKTADHQHFLDLWKKEIDVGGTGTDATGRPTKPGKGDISDGHLRNAQNLDRELDELKRKLNKAKAELKSIDDVMLRLNGNLAATEGPGNVADQIREIDSLRHQLDDFKRLVDELGQPPAVLSAASADEFSRIAHVIDTTAQKCTAVKASFETLSLLLQQSKVSVRNNPDEKIRGNTCGNPPSFADGKTIKEHIDSFQKFLTQCGPGQIPKTEIRDISQEENVLTNLADLMRSSDIDPAYVKQYRNLQVYFNKCLVEAPFIASNDANIEIISNFHSLLLKYNPAAHEFTRAVAAFQRGDLPAQFAACIAVLIDLLILIAGIAMRKPVASNRYTFVTNAEIALEHDRERFLEDNEDLVHRVLWVMSQDINPKTMQIGGVEDKFYNFDMRNDFFSDRRHLIKKLFDLHLIHLEGNMLYLSESNKKFLEDAMLRLGSGVRTNV